MAAITMKTQNKYCLVVFCLKFENYNGYVFKGTKISSESTTEFGRHLYRLSRIQFTQLLLFMSLMQTILVV